MAILHYIYRRERGACGTQAYAYHGAVIDPSNDNHDVNWPYDVIFDPRATMMYASFALGFAGRGSGIPEPAPGYG